ncbi:MAG: hypothetical protein LC687_07975, partial [Actinobacteria bacterium]|nr:hypothetical protein [Actinomycetota bacterium]
MKKQQTVVPANKDWYVAEPHGKDLDMNPVISWLVEHGINAIDETVAFCRPITVEGLAAIDCIL